MLGALVQREDLTGEQTRWAMGEILAEAATPAQIAGFAVALRSKGETIDEVIGLLDAMYAVSTPLAILDGEAVPAGGMGIARQLKDEIYRCPPILVLIGRPQDAWLATWSRAEAVVPHPIDPVRLAEAVTDLLRPRVPATR